mmetsp:Transcript_63867/g.101502  ORF Transcript_63867/g.101502 Transcript_63867/m.101502 type:complete len:289 (+) Transcript_63867:1459-2325(+)
MDYLSSCGIWVQASQDCLHFVHLNLSEDFALHGLTERGQSHHDPDRLQIRVPLVSFTAQDDDLLRVAGTGTLQGVTLMGDAFTELQTVQQAPAPIEEGQAFPDLIEVLLNLLMHLRNFSLRQHHHRHREIAAGTKRFEEFVQQIEGFFTPTQDQDVISIPNAALGLAPTIHGRADPFHDDAQKCQVVEESEYREDQSSRLHFGRRTSTYTCLRAGIEEKTPRHPGTLLPRGVRILISTNGRPHHSSGANQNHSSGQERHQLATTVSLQPVTPMSQSKPSPNCFFQTAA